MKRTCLTLSILALAGCAASQPSILEFNGDSVKITVRCGMGADCYKPRVEDLAQADQTCGTRGRKAQFASTAMRTERAGDIDFAVADHLYICV